MIHSGLLDPVRRVNAAAATLLVERATAPQRPFRPTGCQPRRYAALDVSLAASGAGPQIYAENVGVGSSREPREMMIPIGSPAIGWMDGFFIDDVCIDVSSENCQDKADPGPSPHTSLSRYR